MLRDYQLNAIESIEKEFENGGNRCLLQMPTGAGKTYVFCELAKRFFLTEIKKVLILVHRKELLKQAYESLGERCFKIEAKIKNINPNYDYYVGMVETVNRRIQKLPEFGLIIIDEAHIGNFNKLDFFKNESIKIVGVSATPSSSNKISLSDMYKKIIIPTSISFLIKNNYLVDAHTYSFEEQNIKNANFKTDRSGDYNIDQMSQFYEKSGMIETVINNYWKHIPGKKTMVFNTSIKHNKKVHEAFLNEGLKSYYVDSLMSDEERDEKITSFIEDPYGIMNNVGILTTGFDCPSIEAIILNRATKSINLYYQMIGRGARTAKNKEYFTILDLGNNAITHSLYSSNVDWEYYFKKSKKESNSENAAPTKTCPKCGGVVYISAKLCPLCNYVFPIKTPAERLQEKLVKLNADDPIKINIKGLIEIGSMRGWNVYAYPYKIAEHLLNYQRKHKDIIDDDTLIALANPFFEEWCKITGKGRTQWNKDFFHNAIKKVQSEKK